MRSEPPWKRLGIKVRREYARCVWAYALGRPAAEHPKYREAVKTAKGAGWDPWWVRGWGDVPAVLDGCWFDEDTALRVCEFFEKFLKLSKGRWRGKPFKLMDWQRFDFLMPLFGWKRLDKTRRYRNGSLWIPKKNGKSQTCAGIGIYGLVGDGEGAPEVYAAAGDRKQAGIIHDESARMVRASKDLDGRLKVVDSTKHIAFPQMDGKFAALSADAGLQEGLDWSMLLFDELHVQRNRTLWDTLDYGGAAREQPLEMAISTAGVYDPNGIGWEQCERARQILDGAIEDWSYFALIYGAGEKDDWEDPKVWVKANPAIGMTITMDFLREQFGEAKRAPAKQNAFKRYRLNQWVQQFSRWIDQGDWMACADEIRLEDFKGRDCYAGVDLSSTTDLTAVALLFPPEDEDEPFSLFTWFWLPGDNLAELGRRANAPYLQWAKDGYLETTDGNVVDYQAIRAKLNGLQDGAANIGRIGCDPFNATSLITDLQSDGFDVAQVRQGYLSLSAPTKELEKMVISHKRRMLVHTGHPVMNWNVSSSQVATDPAGNVKVVKSDSKHQVRFHVDGVIAAVNAVAVYLQEGPVQRSVYETEELMVL